MQNKSRCGFGGSAIAMQAVLRSAFYVFTAVQTSPPEGAAQASFTAAMLREAIHQVACAAADSDARPVLAGVYVRLHESTATLAAADGFRLALKQIALPVPVATKQEVIIPAPALRELGGLHCERRT
jgi:DNA polymerase III subunit beta